MDLTDLKDISILVGIWVTIYGVDSWRREHKGRRSIDLAEETLALFYEARDVIKNIRDPGSFAHESEEAERQPGESDAEYDARKKASVVFYRYNKNRELFNRIHALRYRFMAQIGKEKAKPFDDFHDIVNKIFLAARRLARYWPRDHFRSEEEREKHYKRIEELENVFWHTFDENDPINSHLDKVVEDIERTCQDVIIGKGTLFSILNRPIFKKS